MFFGAPGGSRTPDTWHRKPVLYPLSYRRVYIDYTLAKMAVGRYNHGMIKSITITGGRPLTGEITVSGAKNAASKMMLASLLTAEPVILHNCPRIGEVEITAELCKTIGAKVEMDGNTLHIQTPKIKNAVIKRQKESNRMPVLAISPLLHRHGSASVPHVGGDKIGPRPVDFHIEALKDMGAEITETRGGYEAKTKRLRGTSITLPYPSVGATENIIMAAVLAEGRTYINNAAIESEIVDLMKMLQQMGAIIEFRANRQIIIDGVEELHGVEYTVLPDRMQAGSFGMMAIATGGDILVKGARQDDMMTLLNTIRRIGADYSIEEDGIRFFRSSEPLQGVEIETDTHPGFMTDWQQPLVVLLTQAHGMSVVHETVYEDRFGYTETLRSMGANIKVFNKCLGELQCRFNGKGFQHSAVITGPTPLHGIDSVVPDIRAGIAQVIAALTAQGESTLTGVEHLVRGYEDLFGKLEAVGAQIKLN